MSEWRFKARDWLSADPPLDSCGLVSTEATQKKENSLWAGVLPLILVLMTLPTAPISSGCNRSSSTVYSFCYSITQNPPKWFVWLPSSSKLWRWLACAVVWCCNFSLDVSIIQQGGSHVQTTANVEKTIKPCRQCQTCWRCDSSALSDITASLWLQS